MTAPGVARGTMERRQEGAQPPTVDNHRLPPTRDHQPPDRAHPLGGTEGAAWVPLAGA